MPRRTTTLHRPAPAQTVGILTAGVHGKRTGDGNPYGRITITRSTIPPGARYRVKEVRGGFILTRIGGRSRAA